ncbi:hypothetical protein DM480_05925 [Sphingomonas sp. FARSPH]|nr:hypothetical protein DM480_05925 [Sphingomonas sp. FARSPH]
MGEAMRAIRTMAAAGLLLAGTPAAAQVADPLEQTTDPADRAVMAEAADAVSSRKPDLARLDAVLAKLPRPTPLRGMVQTVRAGALAMARDPGPAVAAIEDALRLLPDDPRPKLVAVHIFTFSGSPQRAADLWLAASREAPDFARMTDRYVLDALTGRLAEIGDRARADRILAREGEIGYSAALAPERSGTALAATLEAMRAGKVDEAATHINAIADPDDLMTLYIDRRYAALWPRIAEWAGDDLSGQSLRYTQELRRDWVASDTFDTATPYARRLASLRAYDVVIKLFLPMFDRVQPGGDVAGAEFLAPVVARALASTGRGAEARALLAKTAAALPDAAREGGNALNIDAAYLTLAWLDADWPDVIARSDAFLKQAKALGTNVNRNANLAVQARRACALFRAGREAEAQPAMAEVLLAQAVLPDPALDVLMCRGDTAGARALVIRRLADENMRGWALRFVQPASPGDATPIARLMRPIAQAVRTAPDVVKAANAVGRILPQPVDATLPKGFDPYRAQPTAAPLGTGAT